MVELSSKTRKARAIPTKTFAELFRTEPQIQIRSEPLAVQPELGCVSKYVEDARKSPLYDRALKVECPTEERSSGTLLQLKPAQILVLYGTLNLPLWVVEPQFSPTGEWCVPMCK